MSDIQPGISVLYEEVERTETSLRKGRGEECIVPECVRFLGVACLLGAEWLLTRVVLLYAEPRLHCQMADHDSHCVAMLLIPGRSGIHGASHSTVLGVEQASQPTIENFSGNSVPVAIRLTTAILPLEQPIRLVGRFAPHTDTRRGGAHQIPPEMIYTGPDRDVRFPLIAGKHATVGCESGSAKP